jgi:hypothetical protein
MKLKGTLKERNDDKGFGFISPCSRGADVFPTSPRFKIDPEGPSQGRWSSIIQKDPKMASSGRYPSPIVVRKQEKPISG